MEEMKMVNTIDVIAGHCSSVNEAQIRGVVYTSSLMLPVLEKYGINHMVRDGPYKPRTELMNNGTRNFEGLGPEGVEYMGRAARDFGVPVATEIMSQTDLRHFFNHFDIHRDRLWVGARDSQGYALLTFLGLTPFSAIVKNAMQGTLPNDAKGSLERFTEPTENPDILAEYDLLVDGNRLAYVKNPNKVLAYCLRGHVWPIAPDGKVDLELKDRLLQRQHQYVGSRNVNNIEAIGALREHPFFQKHGIRIYYDPSHVFGGTPNCSGTSANQLRKLIGEYAIRAVTEFGYDGLLIEVHDTSITARTDRDQALVTTYNGIDYSQTNMGEAPKESERPLSLVDILKGIMQDRVNRKLVRVSHQELAEDFAVLDNISWNMQSE